MLIGFEKQTKPLTPQELELVPLIVKGLNNHVGKNNKITNKEVCNALRKMERGNLAEPRFRAIVHHIRTERLIKFLCADNRGYWIAESLSEYKDWIKSVEQRIASEQEVVDAAKLNLPKDDH